jgi:aminomethyltransferase
LQYTSALAEHHAVRQSCGIFDVSHMTVVDLTGPDSTRFLMRLLANDPGKLKRVGQGLYSCMLNDAGGVVDDLIVYRLGDNIYRIVINAATRVQDLGWMARVADRDDVVIRHRDDFLMIAVQGPKARELAAPLLAEEMRAPALALRPFECVRHDHVFVARTGYTGEDGFEIVLPVEAGIALWRALAAAGAVRCGLGSRDTLRLEAALNLYGQDMDAGPRHWCQGWAGRSPLSRRTATSVAVRHWKSRSLTASPKSSPAWCWRIAVSCATASGC